jgi:glycosyltransferase involved in cell wall biosynthesis
MSTIPVLSLCIPSYQNAQWLSCGLSIALQQAKELEGLVEVIVSDNASEDETPLVIADFKEKYGKILIDHRNPINIGFFENCKKVIDLAKGRYCWLIGNNDVLEPDALKTAVYLLQENAKLSYFFCNYSYFNEKETPVKTFELKTSISPITKDLNNYPVDEIRELVHLDCGVFTPLYGSIMLREHWLHAMKIYLKNEAPFNSLASSAPHALYIIEHLLEEPGYYIGHPLLKVSNVIRWNSHFPYYELYCLPTLYRLLEQKGISPEVLKKHRQTIAECSGYCFLTALKTPRLLKKQNFSLSKYIYQNWRTAFFWKIIRKTVQVFLKSPLHNLAELSHCPN